MVKLRVKDILREKGITQKELSDKLGMTEVGLSKAINENGNPPLKRLKDIANVLNIDFLDLFIAPHDETTGFIKHNGTTYEINSTSDLENLLKKIKE